MTVTVDLGSDYLAAGQRGASVALRLDCSREALTEALFTAYVTDLELCSDSEVATLAASVLLMQGAHAMHMAGLRHAAEWGAGRMPVEDMGWWRFCWLRVGEVFFDREPSCPVCPGRVADLSATPLAVAFGAAVAGVTA